MTNRERIEWSDIWVEAADGTKLPRVLLIGDSITRSYYPRVKELLADRFACARFTTSRCACDPNFVKELSIILGEYEFSVIHFNNGLHGWGYDEEIYGQGLAEVFDYLAGTAEGARIIWATTTPVWLKDGQRILDVRTERVRERNRLADEIAFKRGIEIDDLFSVVIGHPEYVTEDGVHFKPEGQEILGYLAADIILRNR